MTRPLPERLRSFAELRTNVHSTPGIHRAAGRSLRASLMMAVAVGAESAAIHLDKLPELREDATRERLVGAEHAAEAVRETWRALEELNLAPQLAFEALFIRIGREL